MMRFIWLAPVLFATAAFCPPSPDTAAVVICVEREHDRQREQFDRDATLQARHDRLLIERDMLWLERRIDQWPPDEPLLATPLPQLDEGGN